MIENPYVSIVSGTFNRIAFLKGMIESARKSIGVGIPYEFVIVDGGSTDGSIQWLRKQSDVVLLEQGKLIGAVKAFNAGFKVAKGKYVLIANDDIAFRYESIMNSIAFMDDHPECGVGCFPQSRNGSSRYSASYMPSVRNGKKSRDYFGQVCIVPKWLGDKVGWWDPGDNYYTYAGDCELSCNVLELGYKCMSMDSCCIDDFGAPDELRITNSSRAKEDSDKWHAKWTKDGLLGARVVDTPVIPNPLKRAQRMIYAPLFEDQAYPHQLKTKFGLRKALSERYLVSEINYRRDPDTLYYAVSMFLPDVCLFQVQDPKIINYDFMMKLRDEFPKTKFVSWNGDYHIDMILSKEYMQVMKLFDLATFVSADFVTQYESAGINYRYWQIGFEEYEPEKNVTIDKDIVFIGNCYNPKRQQMGEMLRAHKDWKVGLYGAWPSHVGSDGNTMYDFKAGDVIYRSSKISIGDNLYTDSVGYVSNRLFQALHAGSFLLQQKIPGMEELLGLKDGEHLIIWETLEDLQEKITNWLPRNSARDKIARNGKKFVDENHSFANRVEEFQKLLDQVTK